MKTLISHFVSNFAVSVYRTSRYSYKTQAFSLSSYKLTSSAACASLMFFSEGHGSINVIQTLAVYSANKSGEIFV